MTRDEWPKSPLFLKLRLLNHRSHEIRQITQEIYDLLAILDAEYGPLVGDRFRLAERQLRIMDMEASRLIEYMDRMCDMLRPKFEGE
jgi:signal transduction histidine kinase